MIYLQRQGLIVALLACFNLAMPVLSQPAPEQTFNMDVRFDWFPGQDPQVDPSDGELSALMCNTQIFLSRVLQDSSGNPTVTMEAKDIAFQRGVGDNNTEFHVSFWGNFSTAEGGSIPPPGAIIESFRQTNPFFNASSYIVNYVHPSTALDGSGTYFYNVREMSYNGSYGMPRPGSLPEAVCAITDEPTFPPSKFLSRATYSLNG